MEEKIIDKIRKLLNKQESAKSVGNLEEADAFALKVTELLTKYNLSIFDIKEKEDENAVGYSIHKDISKKKNEGEFIFDLYNVICKFNYGKLIILSRSDEKYAMIIGTLLDIEIIRFLGDQLAEKFRFLARKAYSEHKGISIKKGKFIRDFLKGATTGLYAKYYYQREEQERIEREQATYGNTVTALVLSRNDQIERVKNEIFDPGRLKQNKPRKTDKNIANSLGYIAGKEVDINKGLNGNAGTREINSGDKIKDK